MWRSHISHQSSNANSAFYSSSLQKCNLGTAGDGSSAWILESKQKEALSPHHALYLSDKLFKHIQTQRSSIWMTKIAGLDSKY